MHSCTQRFLKTLGCAVVGFAACVMLASWSTAFAAVSAPPPGAVSAPISGAEADTFARIDADKNGTVSPEEFMQGMPQMQRAAFDAIDANKDSVITREEWNAFTASHGKRRMGEAAPTGARQSVPSQGTVPSSTPPTSTSPLMIRPPQAK